MKWFEYKHEVDGLHAPDTLKQRLLALQTDPDAPDAPRMAAPAAPAAPKAQKAVPFARLLRRAKPWHAVAATAACCALVFTLGMGGFALRGASAAPMESAGADNYYSSESKYSYQTALDSAAGAPEAAPEMDAADVALNNSSVNYERSAQKRMIIYTAQLELESTEYDAARAALDAAAEAAGGYVESVEEYGHNYDRRTLQCTYRIPADCYADFLAGAQAGANLVRIRETADDVTAQYIDLTARVEALTTQRDRLLELQAQAESLGDLLAIEDQLTSVQYQLESWQQQLNYLSDQVSYCTVTVTLEEVKVYTPTDNSLPTRLKNAFTDAVTDFGDTLADLLLWFVHRWPWVLVIGGAAGIVLLRKRRSK